MAKVVSIVFGAAGALAFLIIAIGLIWFCKSQCRNLSNRNSDTGSSDPSALVEWNRGAETRSAAGQSLFGAQGLRQFELEALEQATKQFSESNLIGHGSFGPVYKGLLRDTVVAIKRRPAAPQQEFVAQVMQLAGLRHRNLVTLLGYCQEGGYQMLVFEYLPNGSISNHLYDAGVESSTRLEFKQRLSIALGAARGLCYLHSLQPTLIHKNFKTANVLVDENFIAKVSDAGVLKLLEMTEEAGPPNMSSNAFRDPEVGVPGMYTETSDIYSFGVFLLELITGQEAVHIDSLGSYEGLIEWVRSRLISNNFVDHRIAGSFTVEGIRDLIRLTLQCMSVPARGRPGMDMVVQQLEQINEKEMVLTTVMGEGTTTITLGSELFASK